ncbi:hypothetical protein [Geobacillus subterraneus]
MDLKMYPGIHTTGIHIQRTPNGTDGAEWAECPVARAPSFVQRW